MKFEVQSVTMNKSGITITLQTEDKKERFTLNSNDMNLKPGDVILLSKDLSGEPFVRVKTPQELSQAQPCSDCPDSIK